MALRVRNYLPEKDPYAGSKTELQWRKENRALLGGARGEKMWPNRMCQKAATYYTIKETRPATPMDIAVWKDERQSKQKLREAKIKKERCKTALFLKALLREQFDRIIYILEKTTGFKISEAFAKKLLESYVANESWMYYDSTQDNLPYMLLIAAEPAYTLVNQLIEQGSGLYDGILKNCKTIELISVNNRYAKAVPIEGKYSNVTFLLTEHRRKVDDETFSLQVVENDKVVYRQKVEVDPGYLKWLIKLPEERSFRNTKLLNIANEVLDSFSKLNI